MKAQEKLQKRISEGKHICVGLDSDINKIPEYLKSYENPILEFNKIIIQNTYENAAAYKINLAFYEDRGSGGFRLLEETLKFIPDDILIIGDAKRGDIGNTSLKYAQSLYEYFKFDSATLHPYMGLDSVEPFLNYEDKINFVLALTSNKSSADFEKLRLENGKFLYEEVIEKVNEWNRRDNCGIVFGATNLVELKNSFSQFERLFLLLPGVGAQGGDLENILKLFRQKDYHKFLVNVSRGIIYSSAGKDFGSAAKKTLIEYNNKVKKFLYSF